MLDQNLRFESIVTHQFPLDNGPSVLTLGRQASSSYDPQQDSGDTMELYLVRHGQSEGNAGVTRQHDPLLTELGQKQARWVARRLMQERFDVFYTSPMTRALQTSQVISEHLEICPQAWPDLCEKTDWGDYHGLPRSEIRARFPEVVLPDSITEDGWWQLGTEDEEAAYDRAAQIEAYLRQQYEISDQRVILVGHGTFGAILMSRILGAGPCGYTRFSQHNACISQIEILPGRAKLRYLNRVDHLPTDALT